MRGCAQEFMQAFCLLQNRTPAAVNFEQEHGLDIGRRWLRQQFCYQTQRGFVHIFQGAGADIVVHDFGHQGGCLGQGTGADQKGLLVLRQRDEAGDDLGDDPDLEPRPPIKKPKINKPGIKPGQPGQKSLTVTITLAEQPGGFWKVEKFTVP